MAEQQEKKTFEDYNLPFNLLRGVSANGFESPSPIQEKTIPVLIEGKELIAQAHSGAGKSLAFIIGSLYHIDANNPNCQSLILSPTRELAEQTHSVATQVGQYMKINIHSCIGGTNVGECINNMKKAQMVIATPGRLHEMLRRNKLNLSKLKILVIDEPMKCYRRVFLNRLSV